MDHPTTPMPMEVASWNHAGPFNKGPAEMIAAVTAGGVTGIIPPENRVLQ